MRVLITGASGFLGRTLAEKLAARNYTVRGLVRKTSRVQALQQLGIELCYGDLVDRDSLIAACRGADVVFHTAAEAGHWGPRRAFTTVNVQGTHNLMEAVAAARVSRLIHFSSATVYGWQLGRLTEQTPRQSMGDWYADSKIAAEELVLAAAERFGFALTVLRPGEVYGPYDQKWLPMLAENVRKGRMRVIGPGKTLVPAVYGEDVAELAIRAAESRAAVGEILNVGSGEKVTWEQFLSTLAAYLGTTLPRGRLPVALLYPAAAVLETLWKLARAKNPPPIIRFSLLLYAADRWLDSTKATQLLGYRPKVFHQEGLKRTLEWLRQYGESD